MRTGAIAVGRPPDRCDVRHHGPLRGKAELIMQRDGLTAEQIAVFQLREGLRAGPRLLNGSSVTFAERRIPPRPCWPGWFPG